jgi:homoserine dehydrogenase
MAPATLSIAIVGVGLVGKEFILQLRSLSTSKYPFKVVYISNSTTSISDPEIDLFSWADKLSKVDPKTALKPADLGQVSIPHGSKKVVVDNTSSDEIARLYPLWLKNAWNIVTPNKKALSSDLSLWEDIKASLGPNPYTDLRLGYEATVGAGLPIIRALTDLVETGDEVSSVLNQPSAERLIVTRSSKSKACSAEL